MILGLILLDLFLHFHAAAAVVGSRQRYVALSLRRVTSWLIDIAFIADGLIALITGDQEIALWYIIIGVFGIVLELRTHNDDDDWFNGRGTKIKKGIRRMLAGPVQRGAPAFGLTAHDPICAD